MTASHCNNVEPLMQGVNESEKQTKHHQMRIVNYTGSRT